MLSVHVPPSFCWGSIALELLKLLENKEEEWKREKRVLRKKTVRERCRNKQVGG